MRSRLEKFMKHPYFSFSGWLFGIIGILLTIVIFNFQLKKVSISFLYASNLLVTDSLSEMEGLDIKYKGNTINQLSVTTCTIKNVGNTIIEDADIYEGHKITISPEADDIDVLFATVVSESYDTIGSIVSYDGKSVILRFDTLEKGDSIVINIYHSGTTDTAFRIDGKIKDGKIISSDTGNSVKNFLMALAPLVVGTLLGFYLEGKRDENGKKNNKFTIDFLDLLLIIVFTIFGLMVYGVIKVTF